MRPVTAQFLKNPDHLHWGFQAYLLGEDEWGVWLALPQGSTRWKGPQAKPPTTEDAVFCAPREAWWHLHYGGAGPEFSHFVDIATPPVWRGDDRYEMIDLDLDVAVHQDGTIEIQDEDEFAEHQVRYHYTDEMIERARAATDYVVSALHTHQEPFFDVASGWLGLL